MEITDLQEGTRSPELQLVVLEARTDADLDRAFEEAVRSAVGALMVSADPFFNSRRERTVAVAARHKLPASYHWPEYAEASSAMVRSGPTTRPMFMPAVSLEAPSRTTYQFNCRQGTN